MAGVGTGHGLTRGIVPCGGESCRAARGRARRYGMTRRWPASIASGFVMWLASTIAWTETPYFAAIDVSVSPGWITWTSGDAADDACADAPGAADDVDGWPEGAVDEMATDEALAIGDPATATAGLADGAAAGTGGRTSSADTNARA